MSKGGSSFAKAKKVASHPFHPKYENMIRAIKKYILITYKLPDNEITSSRLRLAINKGVDKGIFSLPNGPNGTIKLVKKEPVKKEMKEAETKENLKKAEKKKVKTVKPKTRKASTRKVVTSTAPAKPKKTLTATKKTRASTAKAATSS